jgi:hypothetical protein
MRVAEKLVWKGLKVVPLGVRDVGCSADGASVRCQSEPHGDFLTVSAATPRTIYERVAYEQLSYVYTEFNCFH